MTETQVGYESYYGNVGVDSSIFGSNGYETFYANVGIPAIVAANAYEWLYSNTSIGQPDPFVFGVSPIKVRVGDSAEVVGRGFGETINQYIPRIQGQQDDGVWVQIPITSLTYYPPTADAYTSDRTISTGLSDVDPSHTRLGFVVPNWATPPNIPIRVTTSDTQSAAFINRNASETFYSNVTS